MLMKILNEFLKNNSKYNAMIEKIKALNREIEKTKAQVLNEPQAKDSALEAVAEAVPAKSVLAPLTAGILKEFA
jgi:hypothetical protein